MTIDDTGFTRLHWVIVTSELFWK